MVSITHSSLLYLNVFKLYIPFFKLKFICTFINLNAIQKQVVSCGLQIPALDSIYFVFIEVIRTWVVEKTKIIQCKKIYTLKNVTLSPHPHFLSFLPQKETSPVSWCIFPEIFYTCKESPV